MEPERAAVAPFDHEHRVHAVCLEGAACLEHGRVFRHGDNTGTHDLAHLDVFGVAVENDAGVCALA